MKRATKKGASESPNQSIRVLIVEDSAGDAELMVLELRRGGFEVLADVVDTREVFVERFRTGTYDVILSDYKLPGWTGLSSLEEVRVHRKDVPLLIVTGALGDERAAECIKAGATDYILKERMARLPIAVRRAMEEKKLREEHARLEGEFRQAQKMQAIGVLASGISHNFNNLLQVIYSYTYVALKETGPSGPAAEALEEIRKASQRAASLTRQLLTFSRRQVPSSRIVNLNDLIRGMIDLVEHVLGEGITLVGELGSDLWSTKVDPGQMEQVLVNLALNARDAMPRGGLLTIETANVTRDSPEDLGTGSHGRIEEVMLAVRDTGVGMDEETRRRIFEPFFTTKQPGEGTGLGLATVYGIVRQNEGRIQVRSQPGRGTTFEIRLPRLEETPEKRASGVVPFESSRGSETLLVVEDDLVLRRVLKSALEDAGYRVLVAGNGLQALEVAGMNKGPIHLLATDVVMPGMSGPSLAEKLAEPRPGLKVLYFSGSSLDTLKNEGLVDPGATFLPKPFPVPDLLKRVRALLDERADDQRPSVRSDGRPPFPGKP